jgi:hypothetical protein
VNRAWQRKVRRLKAYGVWRPQEQVDPKECREHVLWLHHTWRLSAKAIAQQTGVAYALINGLLYPDSVQGRKWITRRTADAIMALEVPDPHTMNPLHKLASVGVARRIEGLHRLGWTRDHIAAMVGTQPATITSLRTQPTVTADMWLRVARAYDLYSMTPGPSKRGRSLATNAGWLPPLAWDDDQIDLPWGVPGGEEFTGSQGRRTDLEQVQQMFFDGLSLDIIASDLNVRPDSIVRACYRKGMNELAQRLEASLPGKRKRHYR